MKKRMLSVLLAAVLAFGFALPALGGDVYVVRDGDVLWRIASAHDVTWEDLAAYNQLRDPHFITVGQELLIPGTAELREYEVVIGEGTPWPVGGTLTLPAGASARNPVPAVMLVHGSGASDRDSNLFGAVMPFFDIAEYLSMNGIAVLRYDNRNWTHGLAMQGVYGPAFSVWEETIEPALYAAELLRNDPRIDGVYILGLSLGAMMAPRIHAAGGGFDGFIFMAGSPRPLSDIILDQNWFSIELAYIQLMFQAEIVLAFMDSGDFDFLRLILNDMAMAFGMGSAMDMDDDDIFAFAEFVVDIIAMELEGYVAAVESIAVLFDAFPHMTAEEAQGILFDPSIGMYLYYLWEMAQHPTQDFIRGIDAPFLILQGANDFQIYADIDFMLYYELMGDRGNVDFILYEGLNHVFMPSAATNLQEAFEEYAIPATVHPQVLNDIAEWIFAQR